MNTALKIERVENNFQHARCVVIRYEVFIKELDGTFDINFDEREDDGIFYLCWLDNKAVGTVRLRIIDGDIGKVEQLAVLKEYRQHGIGAALMNYVKSEVVQMPKIKEIMIAAQDQALKFYTRLGYEITGEGYVLGKFPHHTMTMKIDR